MANDDTLGDRKRWSLTLSSEESGVLLPSTARVDIRDDDRKCDAWLGACLEPQILVCMIIIFVPRTDYYLAHSYGL